MFNIVLFGFACISGFLDTHSPVSHRARHIVVIDPPYAKYCGLMGAGDLCLRESLHNKVSHIPVLHRVGYRVHTGG